IFCSEDVGTANPNLVVQVKALSENYELVKKESRNPKVDESIIAMAVMIICQSPKTREVDDLLNVWRVLSERWGYAPEMPPYALDFHTAEGKRLPKREGLIHWYERASVISNDICKYDYKLWLMRQAHDEWGYSTREEIEALAKEWNDKGYLRFGVRGWWPSSWMLPLDQRPTVPQEDGEFRTAEDQLPDDPPRVESYGTRHVLFEVDDEVPN